MKLLIVLALLIVVLVVGFLLKNKEGYSIIDIQLSKSCFTDDECGPNQFCYLGKCWGYWNYNPMPWTNCKNPYYEPVPASMLEDPEKCSPYCSFESVRGPGGVISGDCFPRCGDACLEDNECPKGCPQCYKGTCQPPFDPTFRNNSLKKYN